MSNIIFKILPKELAENISTLFLNKQIYELRLRSGKNIFAWTSLGNIETNIKCSPAHIEETVLKAANYSIYSVNEQLRSGYISAVGGVRIGVCGEAIVENNEIRTISNITSLNIRFPHEAKGCSDLVLENCFFKTLNNLLIISPPGAGKTTIIRDMGRQLSTKYKHNVLIIDERGEISGTNGKESGFDVGNSDILLNAPKSFGLSSAIRCMRPKIIICDELKGFLDFDAIDEALSCGVKIIATIHASGISDLRQKKDLKNLLENNIFQRYAILKDQPVVGTVDLILDENFNILYKESF